MKKIIKITALILALVCIGTSFASCGKSKEDLANEIKSSMTFTWDVVDYVDAENNNSKTYYSNQIFPNINLYHPGTSILLDEAARTLTIDFKGNIHSLCSNPGKTVYTVKLPVQIKSTSYGTISADGYSVVAEYIYDASVYPGVHFIEPDIIITY